MLKWKRKSTSPPNHFRHTEPLTQFDYHAVDWKSFENQVLGHRKGVNSGTDRHGISLDLEDGWQERLEHDVCLHYPDHCSDPDNPEPFKTELEKRGRKCWEELHSYAMSYPEFPSGEDMKNAKSWFRLWRFTVPNFHKCNCLKHLDDIIMEIPLNLSSRDAFYKTTVDWHNRINLILGKPVWHLS